MDLPIKEVDVAQLCLELARDPRLALLLDLDGTLIPYAATAEAAKLDAAAVKILTALDGKDVDIVVVSGRPRSLIEPLTTLAPHVRWVAEHGAWYQGDNGEWIGPTPAPELEELGALLDRFAGVPGILIERKTLSACVHWRLVPSEAREEIAAAIELTCDEWLESHADFERMNGIESVEVRHCSAHKGAAVQWARRQFPDARFLAIGDDKTDEDMFMALRDDELSIGVGPRPAHARCRLPGPSAVRELLWWIVDVRTSGSSKPFAPLECLPSARPPAQARLVVVSNRTPTAVTGKTRPVGGLVSALEPALRSHEGIWLGWNGGEASGERRVSVEDGERPVVASFEFPPTWKERFYGGFCNRALWPLFHGFAGRVRYSDADWLAYVDANAEFAKHAHELVAADGMVWMHDYHLLLAGRGLRRRGFTGPVGLFLHIPFPEPDLFATLPWADELLGAMLEFDLLGFHTEQWAANFRACAQRMNPDGKLPEIGVLPIGIDPANFAIVDDQPNREVMGLQAALGDRRLILGVDRLDYAKGIPERLLAFERLLEARPEWRGRIAFVQISVPSRADVPEYAELRATVESLVGRINGRFGEADWVPVRYLYRSYDHHVLAHLYRAADVALVTPLRDGLNLVAKEFIASQDPEAPGVLILSRFAGAAAELTDAVITNPFHPDGLAGDLDFALRMGLDERKRRHALLSAQIADKTPERWAGVFLDRLASARSTAS